MNPELSAQRVSVGLHSVLGVIAGYISLSFSMGFYALGFSIAVMLLLGIITKKTLGQGKDKNWWLGNGGAIYMLVWFASWTLLFNLISPLPAKII